MMQRKQALHTTKADYLWCSCIIVHLQRVASNIGTTVNYRCLSGAVCSANFTNIQQNLIIQQQQQQAALLANKCGAGAPWSVSSSCGVIDFSTSYAPTWKQTIHVVYLNEMREERVCVFITVITIYYAGYFVPPNVCMIAWQPLPNAVCSICLTKQSHPRVQ